jgi:hypothetical protein
MRQRRSRPLSPPAYHSPQMPTVSDEEVVILAR